MSLEHNEDELDAPEWLNADYFTNILRDAEHDADLHVKSVAMTPATFKGDHFASIMFRARIEYVQRDESKTTSLIVKLMPIVDSDKTAMLKESKLFETEISIYDKVIPKFEAILKAAGFNSEIAPRCLYTSLTPQKMLIFEDIVPAGYNIVRERSVELPEIKLAVGKLAKWHAVSYKLALETPGIFNEFCYGLLSEANNTIGDFMYTGMDPFIEMLEETPELQQYAPVFKKIKPLVIENSKKFFNDYFKEKPAHKFYALCHGDFHMKNIMFRTEPFDVKLIDFQICYMGPLVLDVVYLMMALIPPTHTLQYRDEVAYSYFHEFVETLKAIGFEGELPRYSAFRAQLMEHRHFEIFLVVTMMPMVFALMTGKDVTNIFSSAETRKSMYHIEEFKQQLQSLLAHYLHMGYFEE